MSNTNKDSKAGWAILEFAGSRYQLKENHLQQKDAETLANGKYRGRDIIITVSSEDISGRIAGLNSMVCA